MRKYSVCMIVLLSLLSAAHAGANGKHPFGVDDWAALHRARAIAVAPDGETILYRVDFGAAKGPDQHEWKLIAAQGSGIRTLKLPEHFTAFGFTRDGAGLYGAIEDEKAKKKQFVVVTIAAPGSKPFVFSSAPTDFRTAVISPDGSRFAIIANPQRPDPLAEVHTVVENKPSSIYVVNANGSDGAWWCPSLTQVAEIGWKLDGSSIAIVSQTLMIGFHYVYSFIDICSATETRRVAEIHNSSASEGPQGYGGIAWTRDGKDLAFLSTTTEVLTPDHVRTVPVTGGHPTDRTPDSFPAGYEKGKRYPFLVFPHGGPEANDSFDFDPFARLIAGLGYVVIQPEYRGSTGYGSDFLNAIYQHFGDRAYSDVDSATTFAIEQGWADPAKLTIFGWSAGGFMTSWTVTQTHRYRASVEGAGITDWLSFIWSSDVQQIDYDARWPEKDPEAFLKFSPVMRSEAVTTPLLILHGAADERVPTYQGREYYLALAAHRKTVRMVTYPGSPHFPKLQHGSRITTHKFRPAMYSAWRRKAPSRLALVARLPKA
jgi:dipeptidyl aminopeptidase/acylaminoacyl peptidase